MRIIRITGQAFRAIGRNKARSFLTSLGIIIGIASVISLTSIVQGAQDSITSSISSNGTKTITINSGATSAFGAGGGSGGSGAGGPGGGARQQQPTQTTRSSTLTDTDLKILKKNSSTYKITDVAAYVSSNQELTLKDKDSQGNAQTQFYTVVGTEPGYFNVQSISLSAGRLFTAAEVDSKAKVIVLGSQAAQELFGSESALSKTVKLGSDTYTVIGVTKEKTQSGFSNPNSSIYGAYTSVAVTYTITNLSSIYANAIDDASVDSAKSAIDAKLLETHGKTTATRDFTVSTQKDLLNTISSTLNTFKLVLGGIAGISLVVGGIGIMNIMLVAVTERTKEIGLRKAVGARTGDILYQFLIESILLCLVGGLAGVAIGMGFAAVINTLNIGGSSLHAVVSGSAIALAVGVSTTVGIIFGLYPAAKAAHKNPIDALRFE